MRLVVPVLLVGGTGAVIAAAYKTERGKRAIRFWIIRPARKLAGDAVSMWAFIRNTFFDMKQNKQEDRYEILTKVYEYLETTGIGDEVEVGLNDRFLGNLLALGEIQKLLPSRREELLLQTEPRDLPTIKQAERYMKFATAAYGASMIVAAQVANAGESKASLFDETLTIKDFIVSHIDGIEKQDILVADMQDGDSLDCLRHMVVVDHKEKAVVLAVRGTLSLSSVFVDIAGFAEEFCGGQAHAGMAKMARAVWTNAEAELKEKLQEFPEGFSLVVTGHSLGAGVACLMTIMAYHENLMPPGVTVKCMAYAPPPVFYPLDAAKEAVQNTTAYVHQLDIVPSLSLNALRRLMVVVIELDKVFKDTPMGARLRIQHGYDKPPEELVQAVMDARSKHLADKEGAPWLAIPAKCLVWLEDATVGEETEEPVFSVALLDPLKYCQRLLDLDDEMVDHHMTPPYEAAFQGVKSDEPF